jgi:hypothetical protein
MNLGSLPSAMIAGLAASLGAVFGKIAFDQDFLSQIVAVLGVEEVFVTL